MSNLKAHITAERIAALKAKNSSRSQIVNSILAAIKQVEVDTRTEQDDNAVLTILNRMVKQRLDSISQFNAAGRTDLTAIEETELTIIKEFLPAQASEAEVLASIALAMSTVGSSTLKDMGKIMALVKIDLHGKADMSKVSQIIKSHLS
jgi:uncharacterized protein YqeY